MNKIQYTYSIVVFDRGSPTLLTVLQSIETALNAGKIQNFEIFLFYSNTKFSLTIDDVLARFPEIKVIGLPDKTAKIDLYNYALQRTKGDFLVFLNSNIKIKENFFQIINMYKDKTNLFSLTPKIEMQTGQSFGKTYIYDDFYFIKQSSKASAFSALNGIAVYKREILLKVNGFDGVYNIFHYTYWSDADVHLRAWQQGYGTVYEPELQVQFLELEGSQSFYTPVIDFLEKPSLIDKLVWNSNKTIFFLSHKPTLIWRLLGNDLKHLNLWGLFALFVGLIRGISRKKIYLKPIYSFEKIISIVEKESL